MMLLPAAEAQSAMGGMAVGVGYRRRHAAEQPRIPFVRRLA